MDFALPESGQAVARLAAEVLGSADPWKELARAGLLDVGPDGLGLLDTLKTINPQLGTLIGLTNAPTESQVCASSAQARWVKLTM